MVSVIPLCVTSLWAYVLQGDNSRTRHPIIVSSKEYRRAHAPVESRQFAKQYSARRRHSMVYHKITINLQNGFATTLCLGLLRDPAGGA